VREIAQGWIEQRGLRIDVKQCRSRSFEGEGKAIRISEARSGGELRDVIVVQFAISGRGALLVGGGDGRARGMSQGKLYNALKRDGFGQ